METTKPTLPAKLQTDENSLKYLEQIIVADVATECLFAAVDIRKFHTKVQTTRRLINALFSKEAGIAVEEIMMYYFNSLARVTSLGDSFHFFLNEDRDKLQNAKTFAELDEVIENYQAHLKKNMPSD